MIIKIHELALGLILNDHTGDFHKLLQNNDDTCNHYRDIQTLTAKIYKIKKVTRILQLWTSFLKGEITHRNNRNNSRNV